MVFEIQSYQFDASRCKIFMHLTWLEVTVSCCPHVIRNSSSLRLTVGTGSVLSTGILLTVTLSITDYMHSLLDQPQRPETRLSLDILLFSHLRLHSGKDLKCNCSHFCQLYTNEAGRKNKMELFFKSQRIQNSTESEDRHSELQQKNKHQAKC